MKPTARVTRVTLTAIIIPVLTFLPISVASAHPDTPRSKPANGAQLTIAPKRITFTFNEKINLATRSARILTGNGTIIPSTVTINPAHTTFTVTPTKPLPQGAYEIAYNIISKEGHDIAAATSFTINIPTPSPTKTFTLTPTPSIPATITDSHIGQHTVTIKTKIRQGEISWHHPQASEPLTWKLTGNGKTASATGILPLTGTWTYTITLATPDTILIPRGTYTIT